MEIHPPFSVQRFRLWLAKVESAPASPLSGRGNCLIWTGHLDRKGYGRFYCPGFPAFSGGVKRSEMILAHRYGIAIFYGPEALRRHDGEHECRIHDCVNPLHCIPLTPEENRRRQAFFRTVPIYRDLDPFEELEELL